MSFISVLFALLLEQVRPLGQSNPVHAGMRSYVRWVTKNLNTGESNHTWLTWSFAVGAPGVATFLIYALLHFYFGWFLAMLWSVAVLYVTLGFRQFSFHFSQIRDALAQGNEDLARELLTNWQQTNTTNLPKSEIIQRVMALSVLAAHRHVFGVLAWYCILAVLGFGPAGAVIYRVSEFVTRDWSRAEIQEDPAQTPSASLQKVADAAWAWVDWLPARITVISFAVVGRFEQAIAVWRNNEVFEDNDNLILAAASHAVGLQFGPPNLAPAHNTSAEDSAQSEETTQSQYAQDTLETPELSHLAVIVGLVWRTVVMWMLLLALLTFACLLG